MPLFPAFEAPLYEKRREAVLRRMREIAPGGATAVFPGMPVAQRNSDVEHAYRADSDVAFLTGFEEPETVVVLSTVGDKPFTLFVRPRDRERETWNGRRAGIEGAVKNFGASQAFEIGKLDGELPKLVGSARTLFYRFGGDDSRFDTRVAGMLRHLRARARAGMVAPTRIEDIAQLVHDLRVRKDARELATMRKAVELTRLGHLRAMKAAKPGVYEYELQSLLEKEFRGGGGRGWGYYPIVAAGENATILHYNENNVAIREGDLVLIDAGAEVDLYTADVTRTFPSSGKFSEPQRRVYALVLRAADHVIAASKPGASIDDLHEEAVRILAQGMIDLGLLKGNLDELIRDKKYSKYYMHRTSHYLGMDVHDVGRYRTEDGKPFPLEPGMVFTVEPGLYIAADDEEAPKELRGIGVRIEDDILVTDNGNENLTIAIPRTVADVEKACS
jgi:Xaa-Pro aminopeptidase